MPLRHIRRVLADDHQRARALVEIEDRIVERATARREKGRISAAEVRRRYDLPRNVLREEVRLMHERFPGEVSADRAAEIVAAGAEPLRDLIGAMHSKMLLAELARQRG